MFTGIVERTGRIAAIDELPGGRRLHVEAGSPYGHLVLGASVSINGCCTTVVAADGRIFSVELMEITLQKTNLGDLQVGSCVNLERPLALGSELGGHLVQGHVDGGGVVVEVTPLESSHIVRIRIPQDLVKYVVATGSIALDGVSMTVAEIEGDVLTVGVIPHTWDVTVFSTYQAGTRVNLEVDLIGKYIEKLLPEKWQRVIEQPYEASATTR
jgi:riboflavin synthase